MKKILSILLAMLMAASAFSGCSKEPDEPEEIKNEIVVESLQQSFTAVIYDSGEDAEFWNAVKAEFENANQGVTINMIVTKDAAFEVRDRILAGNSPDFVYLPSYEETGVTEALIKDKALASLTDVETAAPSGAFENNACKPYEDGISYLAPLFFEAEGLLYNKELLSNNGFSVPQTWDDFIKIAEGCKNKKFEFFTYAGAEPDEFVNIFAAAVAPVIGTEETNKLLDCEEETWANENVKTFAEKIGKTLKVGDVIAYIGGLGAGKTTFTRGLAKGLGLGDIVTSPTFALVNEYRGENLTLYHFDMYRIENADDLESTGYYDYPMEESVFAIEWSENIESVLPKNTIYISIEYLDEDSRQITVKGYDE